MGTGAWGRSVSLRITFCALYCNSTFFLGCGNLQSLNNVKPIIVTTKQIGFFQLSSSTSKTVTGQCILEILLCLVNSAL
jgi:hypothetical protein